MTTWKHRELFVALNGDSNPEALVFVCYRQDDGKDEARLLHNLLQAREIVTSTGPKTISVYFDQTAGAVGNWHSLHEPSLKIAHAFLFIATPGSYIRFPVDNVYAELSWWIRHRQQPPILIETHASGKYIPDIVKKRWPSIQGVAVNCERLEHLPPEQREERIVEVSMQVLGGIQERARSAAFETFFRQRRLLRLSTVFAVLFLLVAAVSGYLWLRAVAESRRATQARTIALDQLRSAVSTIETLTASSESLEDPSQARELLATSVQVYNRVLSARIPDDPDFMFERAWMLNRLAVALREVKEKGWNPLEKQPSTYFFDPDSASHEAVMILERLLKRTDEWRFHLELGVAWLVSSDNSMANGRPIEGQDRARSAVAEFELLARQCREYLCRFQLAQGKAALAIALEKGLAPTADVVGAFHTALLAFDETIEHCTPDEGCTKESLLSARAIRAQIALRALTYRETRGLLRPHEKSALCDSLYVLAFDYRADNDTRHAIEMSTAAVECSRSVDLVTYAKALNLRGDLNAGAGRNQAALDDYCTAVSQAGAELTLDARGRSLLAAILSNIAEVQYRDTSIRRCGRDSDEALLRNALQLQGESIVLDPGSIHFRSFRRNHHVVLARVLLSNHNQVEAAREIRTLINEINDDGSELASADGGPRANWPALQASCYHAAGMAQSLGDAALERDCLESFLRFRTTADPAAGRVTIDDLRLTATVLVGHTKLDRQRYSADCAEALAILDRLIAENPRAPEIAKQRETLATECGLIAQ